MDIRIQVAGEVIFEPKDEADLQEWVKLNTHKWNPSSAPYVESRNGTRFDLQRSNLGKCVCNGCLEFHIPVQSIHEHKCKEWWNEQRTDP